MCIASTSSNHNSRDTPGLEFAHPTTVRPQNGHMPPIVAQLGAACPAPCLVIWFGADEMTQHGHAHRPLGPAGTQRPTSPGLSDWPQTQTPGHAALGLLGGKHP